MRLQNKVLLSLGVIWVLFLFGVYYGAYHYLLSNLLYIESEGNQEILIHEYAYTNIVNHYVMAFVFLSILVVALIGYVLRIIFKEQDNTLQQLNHVLAGEVKKEEVLIQKNSSLIKRAEKTDKADDVLHAIGDHLNSVVASIAVVKEKIENSKIPDDEMKSLVNETASLQDNVRQINHIIKSFQE